MQDRIRGEARTDAGGGDLAGWAFGVLCGLGAAAANEAVVLSVSLALALAGGLPLAALALRRLARRRSRAVVWEASWRRP